MTTTDDDLVDVLLPPPSTADVGGDAGVVVSTSPLMVEVVEGHPEPARRMAHYIPQETHRVGLLWAGGGWLILGQVVD